SRATRQLWQVRAAAARPRRSRGAVAIGPRRLHRLDRLGSLALSADDEADGFDLDRLGRTPRRPDIAVGGAERGRSGARYGAAGRRAPDVGEPGASSWAVSTERRARRWLG